MVYRNNAGRLGSGFISVSLETRWLGHLGGFYVPACFRSGKGGKERLCLIQMETKIIQKCQGSERGGGGGGLGWAQAQGA